MAGEVWYHKASFPTKKNDIKLQAVIGICWRSGSKISFGGIFLRRGEKDFTWPFPLQNESSIYHMSKKNMGILAATKWQRLRLGLEEAKDPRIQNLWHQIH